MIKKIKYTTILDLDEELAPWDAKDLYPDEVILRINQGRGSKEDLLDVGTLQIRFTRRFS
jgi:hypothetical protein